MSAPEISTFSELQIRRAVALDGDVVDCIEAAFRALSAGSVTMPPILSMALPERNGEVDVKTAFAPQFDAFVVKISPGFFDNPKIGLPSTGGLMVALSGHTGQVEAVLADNGYLTDIRTAAAGAVAARHLSNPDSTTAGIIGGGVQARLQLTALTLVRPLQSAVIWARDTVQAQTAANDLSTTLGIPVNAVETAEMAVRDQPIVVTTTPARTPIVQREWMVPGQVLIAMGADHEHKNEIDPACLDHADLYVPDRQAQTAIVGELRTAIDAGLIEKDRKFAELGDIVAGAHHGRQSPEDIIVCDLTGTGIQDTAIANLVLQRLTADPNRTDPKQGSNG